MSVILSASLGAIEESGASVNILDSTPWDVEVPRSARAIFVIASKQIFANGVVTNTAVSIANTLVTSRTSWTVPTDVDGKYTFSMYSFLVKEVAGTVQNEVAYSEVAGSLRQWINNAWVNKTLFEVTSDSEETFTFSFPVLYKAYIFKNKLVLDYIQKVKSLLETNETQNKLFYARNDLDYFSSLLVAAQYNWMLELHANFIEITGTLTVLLDSDKLG